MTPAQKLSRRLQKYAPSVHWQRIENSAGVGCPDLNGCWKGKELWFELKVGKDKERPSQNVWHLRRKEVGGYSYILHYNPTSDILTVKHFSGTSWAVIDSFPLNETNFKLFIAAL